MHPSNWRETGGMIGRQRTLPTYEIVQLENGCFGLLDETQNRRACAWGYASPEDLIRHYSAQAQRRVTMYPSELTPSGEQLVIPGCERRPVDNGKPAQLNLFG